VFNQEWTTYFEDHDCAKDDVEEAVAQFRIVFFSQIGEHDGGTGLA